MDDLVIAGHAVEPNALTETFDTSGGPGGQHANRSETSVRLRLDVTKAGFPDDIADKLVSKLGDSVEVLSSESRSQFRNRALARRRLTEVVEQALKEKPKRRPTRPTRASQHRRIETKKARSETKRLRKRPAPDGD